MNNFVDSNVLEHVTKSSAVEHSRTSLEVITGMVHEKSNSVIHRVKLVNHDDSDFLKFGKKMFLAN